MVLTGLVLASNTTAATFTATYTSHFFTTAHTQSSDIPALYLGEKFGTDAKRRHTALEIESEIDESPNYLDSMARREGFEPPTLRFEA